MKTLIFLPGWIGAKEIYQRWVDKAPENVQILMVDYIKLIPSGQVKSFNENFSRYLDRNSLSKIILVGQSLGGAFAVKFAANHPERVEQLILVDSAGISGEKNFLQSMFNLISSFFGQNYQQKWVFLKILREFLRDVPLQIKLGIYAYKSDVSTEAKQVAVPTIIMWGEKDCLIPVNRGKKLQTLISMSRLIVLKDWGHDWMYYFPEKFWENIN